MCRCIVKKMKALLNLLGARGSLTYFTFFFLAAEATVCLRPEIPPFIIHVGPALVDPAEGGKRGGGWSLLLLPPLGVDTDAADVGKDANASAAARVAARFSPDVSAPLLLLAAAATAVDSSMTLAGPK